MTLVRVEYPAKGTGKIYGDGIWNEGPGPQTPVPGEASTYTHDVCGVSARVNTGYTEDAIVDPDGFWDKKDERAGCVRRSITIEFDDPVDFSCSDQPELCPVVSFGTFMNVNEVGCLIRNPDGTCLGDPEVGEAVESIAAFALPFCPKLLRFDADESVDDIDVHNVWVTLTQTSPKRVWEVQTRPGEDVAVCGPGEQKRGRSKKGTPQKGLHYYHVPFHLIIEEK